MTFSIRSIGRAMAFSGAFFLVVGAASLALATEGFSVYHGPVATTLTTPGSNGHQLGDIRVTSFQIVDADGAAIGRLDATLITTGIDDPMPGDEIRISELVFTFSPGDVIVVGGSGPYSAQAPVFDPNNSLIRPIKGTSGQFAGLVGWCESVHHVDGSWTHTFHF